MVVITFFIEMKVDLLIIFLIHMHGQNKEKRFTVIK